MSSRAKVLGLTKEQKQIYNTCHKKAIEFYNLPKGWVLHHIDPTLQHRDIERYIRWYPEDLQPMSKSEHKRLHNSIWNPMSVQEYRDKISIANKAKHHGGNRPIETFLRGEKHPRAKSVRCVTTGDIFGSIGEAVASFGFTSHSAHCKIAYVCNGERPHYKGLVFE